MAVTDIFSKRQNRLNGDLPDVYVYDQMPQELRVQLVQIIDDGIGDGYYKFGVNEGHKIIHKMLCREYGMFSLCEGMENNPKESIKRYMLTVPRVEHVIDIVEQFLKFMDGYFRSKYKDNFRQLEQIDSSIKEVNIRFKEHGVGYEYVSGEMIRIDSELIHKVIVKPALALLLDKKFKGANDEFLNAHEHYRHGRYKECLTDALKAFESTMKTICDEKRWSYDPSMATAKKLIGICMDNNLFPDFMQSHIRNLCAILESGLPTNRNKESAHGQGAAVTQVSQATASFALHTAATNILFFVESAKNIK